MKSRSEAASRRRAVGSFCLLLSLAFLLCFYYGSFITSRLRSSSVSDGIHKVSPTLQWQRFQGMEDTIAINTFLICDSDLTELIPCLDRKLHHELELELNHSQMEHYERHCPPPERRLNCLIPPPENYTVPIKWPQSRDEVWRVNVPHSFLAFEKSDQHWMVIDGDIVRFPGGGTHFHDGAPKYIVSLAEMLKHPNEDMSNGGKLRNFLDIGCGVASFGAYLLDHDILTMSIAPNDVHENQIQFALERGIPSTLGVLGTKRLPFPSKSFDLAHCSRCRIDWLQRDGILLLEVDRLLRPGGYFVWSSPPVYRDDDEDVKIWNQMSDFVSRMCWTIAAKQHQTVIWAKPLTNECYNERDLGTKPPLCSNNEDPDNSWQVPMKACITPLSEYNDLRHGTGLAPWPRRLSAPPQRLRDLHISKERFIADTEAWDSRVEVYWDLLSPLISMNSLRNIMDMKADLGGFAAALKDNPVWVMNIVPISSMNTLKIVYDRGLIGTMHDWCEAFSTYPRTYDLLHACNVLSDIDNQGCSIDHLLLEMDRILRPMGLLIIRDKTAIIDKVTKYLDTLHWNRWFKVVEAKTDAISGDDEKILVAQKDLWLPNQSL